MLLGVVAALLGLFYNYTLKNGCIFGILGDFLTNMSYKGGILAFIANPLGACIYCSTTWITILLMIIYWLSWCEVPGLYTIIICTLAAIGVQHLLIRIFVTKMINNKL